MTTNNVKDHENHPSTGSQKQSTTQIFEFVAFEDAHRARSYGMRQSWRKRKQERLLNSGRDGSEGHEEKKKSSDIRAREKRPLVAKRKNTVRPQQRTSDLKKTTTSAKVKEVRLLSEEADENADDMLRFKPELDPLSRYLISEYDQMMDSSYQGDLYYSSIFRGEEDMMDGYFDKLLSISEEPLMDFSFLSSLSADNILSPLALDPFDSFPISLTTRHHELLHHWVKSHAAMMFNNSPHAIDFNPMRDVWFPLDLSNAASFYCIMAHSAAHLAYLHGQERKTRMAEVLKYKSEAVSLVNQWVRDEKMALSDATFAAVVRLLTFERYWGTEEEWRIHRDGLDRMIQARGGLSSVKENWRLGLVLQLISLMSKPSWFYPSNNISEISDSFNYLQLSDEDQRASPRIDFIGDDRVDNNQNTNSEIPKLRSLWLISFVQDMRSLMANARNIQSGGLRHYHSIYEAITILRNSFLESTAATQSPSSGGSDVSDEHDRIACLFYIGVMIQECVSQRYHNTTTDNSASPSASEQSDISSASGSQHQNNSPISAREEAPSFEDKSYDRLEVLNNALSEYQSIWKASITQLEGFLLNHFMTHWGSVNGAEYVLHMTEVLTSLSREARNGVERCLLNMFGGGYTTNNLNNGFGDQGDDVGVKNVLSGDNEWTVDTLLMSIRGG